MKKFLLILSLIFVLASVSMLFAYKTENNNNNNNIDNNDNKENINKYEPAIIDSIDVMRISEKNNPECGYYYGQVIKKGDVFKIDKELFYTNSYYYLEFLFTAKQKNYNIGNYSLSIQYCSDDSIVIQCGKSNGTEDYYYEIFEFDYNDIELIFGEDIVIGDIFELDNTFLYISSINISKNYVDLNIENVKGVYIINYDDFTKINSKNKEGFNNYYYFQTIKYGDILEIDYKKISKPTIIKFYIEGLLKQLSCELTVNINSDHILIEDFDNDTVSYDYTYYYTEYATPIQFNLNSLGNSLMCLDGNFNTFSFITSIAVEVDGVKLTGEDIFIDGIKIINK